MMQRGFLSSVWVAFFFFCYFSCTYSTFATAQRLSAGSNILNRAPSSTVAGGSIPIGFRASVDSTGLYIILYRLSQSSADGPRDFILETIAFRASAFANGRIPSLSDRIPIESCDATVRYVRPRSGAAAAMVNLLSNTLGGTDAASFVNINNTVTRVFNLSPTTTTSFALTNLGFPVELESIETFFTLRIVPTSSDLRNYREALAEGVIPAGPNPFGTVEQSLKDSTRLDATSSTVKVVTILLRSYQWNTVSLSSGIQRLVDLPQPSSGSGADKGIVDMNLVYNMRTDTESTPNLAGGKSLWGDSDGDGITDIGGDTLLGQGHEHVLFKQSNPMIPSYFASAAQRLSDNMDTGIIVGAEQFQSNSAEGQPFQVSPVEIRLSPHSQSTSTFSYPSFTVGFWPLVQLDVEWADVQIKLSAVVKPKEEQPVQTTFYDKSMHQESTMARPPQSARTVRTFGVSGTSSQRWEDVASLAKFNDAYYDHKNKQIVETVSNAAATTDNKEIQTLLVDIQKLQNTYNPTLAAPVNHRMEPLSKQMYTSAVQLTPPTVVATDLTMSQNAIPVNLAEREVPNTTSMRYSMAPFPRNQTTADFYHFDANLYALRSNSSNIDAQKLEVYVLVHYQFTFREKRTNSVMRTAWSSYLTKLPPFSATQAYSEFPSAALPPSISSVSGSGNTASSITSTESRSGGVEMSLPVISSTAPTAPVRAPANSNSVNSPTNAATNTAATTNGGGSSTNTAPGTSGSLANVAEPSTTAGAGNIFPGARVPGTSTAPGTSPRQPNRTPGRPPGSTSAADREDNQSNEEGMFDEEDGYFNDLYGFPVSPVYPRVGWNITWFLIKYAPSSSYLLRHDVVPARLRKSELRDSVTAPFLDAAATDPLANSYLVVEAIHGIAQKYIAEVMDVKINIHVNDKYQGTYNMKYIEGDVYDWEKFNDLDGDGERDSPAQHNTDPQAYIRPFEGERWMSPVIQVHPNDLLTYSFTFQARPFQKYVPAWADPNDDAYLEQTATTSLFAYEGARAYVHAVLPVESVTQDPAEIRMSPRSKYSFKLRTSIPTAKASMHFAAGRLSAHDGGLLALPPVESGVCHATSQGLPLRSRHNVWMRLEFMPVSVTPVNPNQGASIASLRSAFGTFLPAQLRGPFDIVVPRTTAATTLNAVVNYVLSQLPPLLEDWWYFDGLVETSSSQHVEDDFHATFVSSSTDMAPFPDPDPGVVLKNSPDEDVMTYAFTFWPEHNDQDVMTTGSQIYSPDSFTSTGRTMGFSLAQPLLAVCF